MERIILYESEYIIISKIVDDFFLQSLKEGLSINDFNDILKNFPQIEITNFIAIKNALTKIGQEPIMFGKNKPRISIEVSSDAMKAFLWLNIDESEFSDEGKAKLIDEIGAFLSKNGIVWGITLVEIIEKDLLVSGKKILIAEGTKPVSGQDSVVTSFSFHDSKPKINEEQKADYYEIDIINRVKKGDCLGEWTAPTSGVSGKNVKGEIIQAPDGKNTPILYDTDTIYEEKDNEGITRIYPMKEGAIDVRDNVLVIKDHLEVEGDVNFKTGNINYNGFLTIKGFVEDHFSVKATQNIEILSSEGLGSVNEVISTEGSIFIKGGINGKEKSIIRAKKNIFLKYAKDVTIICDGTVNIGSYAVNCKIEAGQLILESSSSQIIGGSIDVVSKVSCAIIGSNSEIPTNISLKGVDKNELYADAAGLIEKIDKVKFKIATKEKDLLALKKGKLTSEEIRLQKMFTNDIISFKNQLKELEVQKKQLQDILHTKGDCELIATKNIYPKTLLHFKSQLMKVQERLGSTHLYLDNNEIKQLST